MLWVLVLVHQYFIAIRVFEHNIGRPAAVFIAGAAKGNASALKGLLYRPNIGRIEGDHVFTKHVLIKAQLNVSVSNNEPFIFYASAIRECFKAEFLIKGIGSRNVFDG